MLRFIAADLRRHALGVAAVVLLIALATALGVVVTLQERALRLGSARAADSFDLVVGAPGSEAQLVLSAVFLQPAPLPLVRGSVLAGLLADPRVAWAAPVGFGDFVADSPVVGTMPSLVEGLGGLTEGRGFAYLNEAVVGASVPLRMGARVHPMHGHAFGVGLVHGTVTYEVVGRMAPTGTAWDRAVLVPIEAVWRVHAAEGGARAAPPDLAAPVRPEAVADPQAPGLPAILVKPRSIADAYKLRQDYRTERTLAVFPAEVLTRLYGTLGDARQVLAAVALGAQGLVAAAILLVVTAHIAQRRRQIGALRAFGAPRASIFAIVWLEAFFIIGAGLLAGFGFGYIAARAVSAWLTSQSGVAMPVGFAAQDLVVVAGFLAAGALLAAVPASLAFRQSPAGALRG
ncbi:MAG TPA: ABC transporter permease [Xanthobacteraceae bacterium]|nr:ABC transporter permease [Xanthobacteraceae bacterium]